MKNIFLLGLLAFTLSLSTPLKASEPAADHPEITLDISIDAVVSVESETLTFKNQSMSTVKIGEAAVALKEGKLVRRHSWSPDVKFVFMQVPAAIYSDIVPKMQSLPESAKNYFKKTFEDPNEQIDAIYYHDQLAQVGLSNSVQAYSPTPADLLAEDWEILS